jgi:hypothetical protein
MRKTSTLVAFVLAFAMLAGTAFASHSTWVTFDPGSEVTEGTTVTVAANSDPADTAPKLQLWVCRTASDGVVIPDPVGYADVDACQADDGSAVWVLLVEQGDASEGAVNKITYDFATAGLGGVTVGFMSHRDPGPNVQHPDASGFDDLEILVAGNGDGDHPGCQGIQMAYSKISSNNGSAKGKGGESLKEVNEKLGCPALP